MRSLHAALVLSVVLSACTAAGEAPTAPPAGPPSQPTTATSPPDTSDAYLGVAPAMGLVQTPLATGSGILVSDDLIVTNAHVVWPFRSVDVSFSGGSAGTSLPVVAVDWVADLALIDASTVDDLPAAVDLKPVSYSAGDDVHLVGFPIENLGSLEPAITSGTISSTRTWEAARVRFIESDALISGGQSGGALVDSSGTIIGITSLDIGTGVTLAIEASDVADRIDDMTQGRDPFGIGSRWLEDLVQSEPPGPAAHFLDEVVWMLDTVPGEEVVIEVDPLTSRSGSIIGPDGFLESTLENGVAMFTPKLAGPHFAAVVPVAGLDARIEVTSSVDVTPMRDPDHGRPLEMGSWTFANVDYPGDLDWFSIELDGGESIEIIASSPNADVGLSVGPLSDLAGASSRSDSDSGGGVIGSDAEVRYTATTPGTHIIAVFDETQFGPGAYALRIEKD